MELAKKVEQIAESYIEDDSIFIVDVLVSAENGPRKIQLLLDGDEGVTIDYCALISRKVAAELEEKDLVESQYTLEVSSPGVDFPLKFLRQYEKNIGRWLKVKTLDATDFLIGELLEVGEGTIKLNSESGSGKKKVLTELEIELKNIDSAKVEVRF